ncbi:MAG: hypothetical protein H0W61_17290 [Bacteroidetes bacterium]|nr:hypothetical protein [Bacteroidota bacterium]
MKKIDQLFATSKSVKISLCLMATIILSSFNNNDTVTICHVPPGNPDNCHEITISKNALQTHLDHGDNLFCDRNLDYPEMLQLVNNNASRIIKRY